MHVGEIIHRLRKERKMTLLELSTRSGVALATLSRIENGKMTGTLPSHMSISKALEVSLTDLYKDLVAADKKVEVNTRKAKVDLYLHDRRASSEMLASNIAAKRMMPLMIKIARAGMTNKEETKVGAEKFIYVVTGKIEAFIGDRNYNLMKGDTLYFESSLPHYFKNIGPQDAHILSVASPTSA